MKQLEKYWKYIIATFVICMFLKPILCFLILGSLLIYSGFEELKFLKKIEHKLTFIVKNINFLIAALTGIVAISSLFKMYF